MVDVPVLIAGGTPPVAVADPVTEYVPSARPGSRAPHVWLQRGAERISTIDLFGPHFTLLAASAGGVWREAARGRAMAAFTVGQDLADPEDAWHEAYCVERDGAVLVRPDGYVAWRSRAGAADPPQVLQAAFDRLLSSPVSLSARRSEGGAART